MQVKLSNENARIIELVCQTSRRSPTAETNLALEYWFSKPFSETDSFQGTKKSLSPRVKNKSGVKRKQ